MNLRNVLSLAWRSGLRDWRAGETGLLLASLIVAVAATTSVGFLTDRVAKLMRSQAGEVLAADLRVDSRSALPDRYRSEGDARGLQRTEVMDFPSVILAGERSALAAVKGAGEGYPLRGRHRVSDALFGAQSTTTERPAPGEVWLSPRLLISLEVEVGERVAIGESEFVIGRVLEQAPDQGFTFVDVAPLALIRYEEIAATGLGGPASRVRHHLLFAGEQEVVDGFVDWLEDELLPTEDLDTLAGSQPSLARALSRAERFLGLATLASVLLAGVAVAMATRRHVQRHLDAVAVMKCLGAEQQRILWVAMTQLGLLALVGAVVGSLLGYLAQEGLVYLVRDIVGAPLPTPGLGPAAIGLATAAVILAGFAAAPMIRLRRVPPARVLRRELGQADLAADSVMVTALIAVALLVYYQAKDLRLFLWTGGSMLGTAVVLAVLAALGMALLRGARQRGGTAWRYGLANLVRRPAETTAQLMAFGLGLAVMLLLVVVRGQLLDEWRARFPEDTPNQFLINIQTDEVEGVRELLEDAGLTVPRMYPMVRGRVTEVNGTPASEWGEQHRPGRWFMNREANLTWSPEVQEGNELVEGLWWDELPAAEDGGPGAYVSLQQELATNLGVGIGDRFSFNIGGEPLTVEVSSLREVDWETFRPNFFMVMPPGLLDDYPATWVTSVYSPGQDRSVLVDLVRSYPSVTVIDIDAILGQVRTVIDRATLAVEAVFGFTLLAGLMVLLAAVRTTRDQRMQESAVLRTLGAGRRLVLTGLGVEFAALGVTAGLVASLGAGFTGWAIATQVMELPYRLDPMLPLLGIASGLLLILSAGLLATRSVVSVPPARTLREAV